MGSGPLSPSFRLSTRPLPPAPPRLECANANHNSLKLKWGDAKTAGSPSVGAAGAAGDSAPCQYTLEMENSRNQ